MLRIAFQINFKVSIIVVDNVLHLSTDGADIKHGPHANVAQHHPPLQTVIFLNRRCYVQGGSHTLGGFLAKKKKN